MDSGGISGYSLQAVPHCPQVSSSALLHCSYILLSLLSFLCLFLLLAPKVSDCLGSAQEWGDWDGGGIMESLC